MESRAVDSTNPTIPELHDKHPVPAIVVKAWQLTFDSLMRCLTYKSETSKTLHPLLKILNSHLHNKSSSTFCPQEEDIEDIDELQFSCKCYMDFHNAMTNMLLHMISRGLGEQLSEGVLQLYIKLLSRLKDSDERFLNNLMQKFVSCLDTILRAYMNTQLHHVEIQLGMFMVEIQLSLIKIPVGAGNAIILHSFNHAARLVIFLSKLIFLTKDYLSGARMHSLVFQVLYKRFLALKKFGASDIFELSMLESFSVTSYNEMINVISHVLESIAQNGAESDYQLEIKSLEKQALALLAQPLPGHLLKGRQIQSHLTDILLSSIFDEKSEESLLETRVIVLTKIMSSSPGSMTLTFGQIKWLAQTFCVDASNIPLTLLCVYMESELRAALPFIFNTSDVALTGERLKSRADPAVRQWQQAKEFSVVWQILRYLFLRILQRLSLGPQETVTTCTVFPEIGPKSADPYSDLKKIHLVLQQLSVLCCKLEENYSQNHNHAVHICFTFFDEHLETVIRQFTLLPVLCSFQTGMSQEDMKNELDKWELILESCSYLRYLPEFSLVDQSHSALLDALSGLLWITSDKGFEAPLKEEDLRRLTQYAGKINNWLGDWTKINSNYYQCNEEDVKGRIIKKFLQEFHQYKENSNDWCAKTLQYSLKIDSTELLSVAIQNIPLVTCSCNQYDTVTLIACLSRFQPVGDTHIETPIALALAKILPLLVCSLSGCCSARKKVTKNEDLYTNNRKKKVIMQVYCFKCDSAVEGFPKSWHLFDELENFSQNWKSLTCHPSKNVRLAIAQDFHRIANHLHTTFLTLDVNVWMKLLWDENQEVALAFAQHIPLLFRDRNKDSQDTQKIFESIFQGIYAAIKKCLEGRSPEHWQAVVKAINGISDMKIPFACVPLTKVYVFLIVVGGEDCFDVSQTVISKLASVHETNPKTLFWQSLHDICKIIVHALEILGPDKLDMRICLKKFVWTFNMNIIDFKKQLHNLCSALIPKCVEDVRFTSILRQIAEYLDGDLKEILSEWSLFIYPKICLDHNEVIATKSVQWLLNFIDSKEAAIVKPHEMFIISSLMVEFASKPCKVLRIITHIKQLTLDDIINLNAREPDPEEMLLPHLQGILLHLRNTVVEKYVREDVKIEAMNSITKLLTFMGTERMEPYINQVLDMLSSFSQFKNPYIIKAYCSLVLSFLNCLDVEKHLKPIAHIIVSNLVHFDWVLFHDDLNPILHFFLNQESTYEILTHMTYIGGMLKYFNYVDYVTKMDKYKKEQTLEDIVDCTHKVLKFPREKSQHIALLELKNSIANKQSELQKMFENKNVQNLTLKDLYGQLLSCIASPNCELRLSSSACIGAIGAVSPFHWIAARGFYKDFTFYIDSDSPEFIAASFEMLVHELQSASSREKMDLVSFICQEFMKANDFQDEAVKAPLQIWSLLSESTQLMLTPYFKSSYKTIKRVNDADLPHPIIGSIFGKTLKQWLFYWTCRLIKYIKNEKAKKVFSAMRFIFKISSKCLFFFLPYVFLHALWSANPKQKEKIFDEMVVASRICLQMNEKKDKDLYDMTSDPCKVLMTTTTSPGLHSFSVNDMKSNKSLLLRTSSQVIFYLIDFMRLWRGRFEKAHWQNSRDQKEKTVLNISTSASQDLPKKPSKLSCMEQRSDIIEAAIGAMNMGILAGNSHLCNDNLRALHYLELYASRNTEYLQRHLKLFIRICTQLNDEDSVSGILSRMTTLPSTVEQILIYDMKGAFEKSLVAYQSLGNQVNLCPVVMQNVVKAYLGLEEFHSALALIEKHNNLSNFEARDLLLSLNLEVLWRMGEWDKLKQILQTSGSKEYARQTWASHLAHIFLYMHSGDVCSARDIIINCRKDLGLTLHDSNFKERLYFANYFLFLLMHILVDIEAVIELLESSPNVEDEKVWEEEIEIVFNTLKMRQQRINSQWRSTQQLLAIHRVLFGILKNALTCTHINIAKSIDKHITSLWVQSARLALSCRQFPQCIAYVNNAEQLGSQESFIIRAEVEWNSGNKEHALDILQRGISAYFPYHASYKDLSAETLRPQRLVCAKAKLLYADYSRELRMIDVTSRVRLYKEAVQIFVFCEESWVELARSWLMFNVQINGYYLDEKRLGIMKEVLKAYSHALLCGTQHVYESLPAIINIWANSGFVCYKVGLGDIGGEGLSRKDKASIYSHFKMCTENMNNLITNLPEYVFYLAFPHLSARLCHPYAGVYDVIQRILIRLLIKYPYQMLWKLVPQLKLPQAMRVNRIQFVLTTYELRYPRQAEVVRAYVTLLNHLYKFGFSETKNPTMSKCASYLCEFFKSKPKILMPINQLMTPILPNENDDYKKHEPFPRENVYIVDICEDIEIMNSLQKPKRFAFLGSDGNIYKWLIKVKDDLRIDKFVMDFMQALNHLLDLDPLCRERNLNCHTYSVVPIAEDCGLIEWLENLKSLRDVILSTYKHLNLKPFPKKEIKKEQNVEEKQEIFEKYWLPCFPKVLSIWYSSRFYEHDDWYYARKEYVYSTAVMSVVGYILGLGDRHGGNIMINEKTGKTVHVDFNCLFNKADNLFWPEKVPFRLTQGMVEAMGATGVDGPYLKACELVLNVIRKNMESLFSVIRPIRYDAHRKDNQASVEESLEEFSNKKVELSLTRMRERMKGFLSDKEIDNMANHALSSAGQARALIKMARDSKNLSQMYPGWGAAM